ncbi:MAG: hypothetical protein ACW99G_13350 [Candidatus Thorarchaeota archaeon]
MDLSLVFGVSIFTFFIGIYVYSRVSGRVSSSEIRNDRKDTNTAKLFNSKVQDVAFFDGESEDYAEAVSRLRQFGGA